MIDILLDEQNTLKVGLDVQGVSTKNMKTRLVIETGDGFDLSFDGSSFNDDTKSVDFTIPILASNLVAGEYKSRLEVILDGDRYFVPNQPDINAVMPIKVKAAIESSAKVNKDIRKPVEIKAEITIEEPVADAVVDEKDGFNVEAALEELKDNIEAYAAEVKLDKGKEFQVKSEVMTFEVDETGKFKGLGAKFDNIDSHGDVIRKSAFNRTLNSGRKVMMFYQHNKNEPIGVWEDIKVTDMGLEVEGQLAMDTQKGREIHSLIKMGALDGLSIGYIPTQVKRDKQTGIRELLELALLEVSIVSIPSNIDTRITDVKSITDGVTEELKSLLNSFK